MEEISFIIDVAKEAMEKSLDHLEKTFINIRAGKANPAMLSTVKMEYYGTQTPLSQVANINTPDAQTLSVQPWDKTMIPEIEKAILVANLAQYGTGVNCSDIRHTRNTDIKISFGFKC